MEVEAKGAIRNAGPWSCRSRWSGRRSRAGSRTPREVELLRAELVRVGRHQRRGRGRRRRRPQRAGASRNVALPGRVTVGELKAEQLVEAMRHGDARALLVPRARMRSPLAEERMHAKH